MGSVRTNTADELTAAIRSFVDRALESTTREQAVARGREIANMIAETAGTVAERASEAATDAWRETTPQREEALKNAERIQKEALKNADRIQRDALKWSRRTWGSQLRPAMQKALRDGSVRLAAAGASVPVTRELAERARVRLGVQQREERRWRFFFIGLLLGAAAGALAAILTAPKPGREVRDQLASRAREAAEEAGEWVPLFQRPSEAPEAIGPEQGNNGAGEEPEPAPQAEAVQPEDQEAG